MRKSTQILTAALAAAMLVPTIASCSPGSPETTTAASDLTNATTTAPASNPEKPIDNEKVAKYAEMGRELVAQTTKDYFATRSGLVYGEPKSGQAALWGFGSFLEALADCYALYPEDETLKKNYITALNKGLDKYKKENMSIRNSASGETYRGITYYNATAGGAGDYYYDDNAWICYQLLNAYVQLGNEKYLTEAEKLLEFFKTGWDDTLGGGIHWDKGYGGKNTCADGPIAICFLWAYQLTEKQDYLDWGKKIFDWLEATLKDKGSNLYSDNINKDGKIGDWKADYNQGTPIYAACLLYEITGEEAYLTSAKKTASAALGLAFKNVGTRKKPDIQMNGNPIYKSWCVGWLMRGFYKYVEVSGKAGNYFSYMEQVLDKNVSTKNKKGYYDPYFMTGDWSSESVTDVLQPSGIASVMLICAKYERDVAPKVK